MQTQNKQNSLLQLISERMSRRSFIQSSVAASVASTATPLHAKAKKTMSRFDFSAVPLGVTERHEVADGYEVQVVLRWGDPIFAGGGPFDPQNINPEEQLKRFGYNCDFLGLQPLPNGEGYLLCVNHEYPIPHMMVSKKNADDAAKDKKVAEQVLKQQMAAVGASIVEIRFTQGTWQPKLDSVYNRRISALHSKFTLTGPAAGDSRVRTAFDPEGKTVIGTFNNCSGGMTPWGTYLLCEENVNHHFQGAVKAEHPEARALERYYFAEQRYKWAEVDERFDLSKHPTEANRFGWVAEIDPLDPDWQPRKHSALGRMFHESALCCIAASGQAVVYLPDDHHFEYLYKFVSRGKYDPKNRTANRTLLSEGDLFVAKFAANGDLEWLPLTHGVGPLTKENHFSSPADVMIEARRAADLLGATPLDRPEGACLAPDGVYVMLTNNDKRTAAQIQPATPRAPNEGGHVIRLSVEKNAHEKTRAKWSIVALCGETALGKKSLWHDTQKLDQMIFSPDNIACDHRDRLWITSDQGDKFFKSKCSDGIYSFETVGGKALAKRFFRVPVGAEATGPVFTPDDETFFVSIQHPGVDGAEHFAGFNRKSSFDDPATRWPDFDPKLPPRPSVIAIRKKGGGRIA